MDLYLERGDDIFDVSFKQKLKSLGGVIDEKYDADELEDALKDNIGDTKLKDLLKPCIITSYDIRNRNAFFFRKQRANDKENNFLVRDVARATSAAPTYFETARVKNDLGSPFPLIDGGVFVNNPALCAYSEARNLNFPERGINKPTAKDMVIVSIGTGSIQKSYEYKKAKNWGLVEWIQPIIDIMMSGNSETVDYHLKQIYDTLLTSDKTDYYRLEPQLGTASSDMDDASVENLKALEAAGQDFVQDDENDKTLTEIVNKLL